MPRLTKYWQCPVLALLMITTAPTHAELVVYTAQVIRTMEPALPTATAVAVEDGHIVAVGSEATLQPLVEARGGRIDRQFDDDGCRFVRGVLNESCRLS